uniref:Uncharacterized protein n=1 Tax=Parascaris equorum TaxID=6256 RepID=A0A914S5G3_PAREQ
MVKSEPDLEFGLIIVLKIRSGIELWLTTDPKLELILDLGLVLDLKIRLIIGSSVWLDLRLGHVLDLRPGPGLGVIVGLEAWLILGFRLKFRLRRAVRFSRILSFF